jgi:pimeloyl-ACP methyl ester carboxylesterase
MFMRYTSVVLVLMLLGIELTFARASLAAGAQLSAPPELHWSACPDVPDTECAGLEVPVDPARPDGVQFTLRLGRARATDPARKEGVLLFIPGGPGVGIREMFGQLRALQRIDEFARRYDVVSFDPRGVGQSNPIRCDPDVVPSSRVASRRLVSFWRTSPRSTQLRISSVSAKSILLSAPAA